MLGKQLFRSLLSVALPKHHRKAKLCRAQATLKVREEMIKVKNQVTLQRLAVLRRHCWLHILGKMMVINLPIWWVLRCIVSIRFHPPRYYPTG